MTIAATVSPLTALVWVFAAAAAALAALTVGVLMLAFRHRRRHRSGVYGTILRDAPSSPILRVLTVGDLTRDPELRKVMNRILDHWAHASDSDDLPPRSGH